MSGKVQKSVRRRPRSPRNKHLKGFCDVIKLSRAPIGRGDGDSDIGRGDKCQMMVMGVNEKWKRATDYSTSCNREIDLLRKSSRVTKSKGKSATGSGTPINAFIGFRSYYSRILPSINQRSLSSYLSKVWAEYQDKDFWIRNTVLYCAAASEKSFADWLLEVAKPPDLPFDDDFAKLFALSREASPASPSMTSMNSDGLLLVDQSSGLSGSVYPELDNLLYCEFMASSTVDSGLSSALGVDIVENVESPIYPFYAMDNFAGKYMHTTNQFEIGRYESIFVY
ncbi:uncharacterized protein V1510DRAFT_309415 [Dipodascopsis tothii]|uniref:uncharacterized protein n=1 Tax=Dipodascopsis tothii TaxID=44089 RepID=UPI0034CF17F2